MSNIQNQGAVSGREHDTKRSRRKRRLTPIILTLMFAMLLVGCGRTIPATWPDLAVIDGVVYLANGQVYALNAETGNVIWNYPEAPQRSGGLLGGCSAPKATDGPFTSAPAKDDTFVYLASGGEQQKSLLSTGENMAGLRALNEFGTLQWKHDETTQRAVSPPVIQEGTAYLASSDYAVYAIGIDDRSTHWVFETENWVWAKPVIGENLVYIASMDHTLYAVDAKSGELMWTFEQASSALPTAPALDDGTLYLTSLDGLVYAVDATTGELEWERKIDSSIWATPLVDNDMVYFGTLQGTLYALDAADGQIVWSQAVGGEVRSSPVLIGDALYIGSESGTLHVLDAEKGLEHASLLSDKASIFTTPVNDGQYLYVVATDGIVYALDLENNTIVWDINPALDQEG